MAIDMKWNFNRKKLTDEANPLKSLLKNIMGKTILNKN